MKQKSLILYMFYLTTLAILNQQNGNTPFIFDDCYVLATATCISDIVHVTARVAPPFITFLL